MTRHAPDAPGSRRTPAGAAPGRGRRGVLAALAVAPWATASGRALAAPPHPEPPADLARLDWTFDSDKPFARRAVVLVPRHLPADEKAPTLVLFHGLGEAKQGAEPGAHAWHDRYGAGTCYARLRHPPVASVDRRGDLTAARAAELSAALAARPFGGLVLVCPFTPNIWSFRDRSGIFDALASFVAGPLLERVGREVAGADVSPARTGVDGCSLGGLASLEVWRRQPARFASLGVVQPAINQAQVAGYVAAIKARPGLAVHVETSSLDPYLAVSQSLHAALGREGVASEYLAPPGSHDQRFLRDVGTLEMLLWHDRALRR